MIALEPCPLCNAQAALLRRDKVYQIACRECGLKLEREIKSREQLDALITRWNTRLQSNAIKKEAEKRFQKPTKDEVEQYADERGTPIDAEAFINHYDAVGWKVGKNPMKDWRAAVRQWARRDAEQSSGTKKSERSRSAMKAAASRPPSFDIAEYEKMAMKNRPKIPRG